jgi:hypothetical protein
MPKTAALGYTLKLRLFVKLCNTMSSWLMVGGALVQGAARWGGAWRLARGAEGAGAPAAAVAGRGARGADAWRSPAALASARRQSKRPIALTRSAGQSIGHKLL